MRVSIDVRTGSVGTTDKHVDANISLAVKLMHSLDGKRHTLLNIDREDGWQMNIGGGERSFVVTLSSDSDENYSLASQNQSNSDPIEICAGGQFAEFPAAIVVDPHAAKTALEKFYSRAEAELDWI